MNLDGILTECYSDIGKFGKTFSPEIFELNYSSVHQAIIDALNSKHQKVIISAPRGIGKTSFAREIVKRAILYQDTHFVCYIGKSATYAEMQTENIKEDLRHNTLITDAFGDIKQTRFVGGTDTFSKKAWIAYDDCFVLPRGMGQQIRGLNWRGYRPDLFVIDDLEDDEELENEDIRKKRKIWFFAQVLKAKPIGNKPYKFIWIDTLKHEDALLVHIMEDDDWHDVHISICDENYKTLAPDFMSQVELDKELAMHRRQGIMDVFAREYMGVPVSREDAVFRSEYFNYYNESDDHFRKRLGEGKIESVVIIDPAKTTKMHNAKSGIVVWGVDVEEGRYYLREARGESHHPEELYNDAFVTAKQYGARTIAVEVTSLEEFIKNPFTNEMIRQGYNYELVWLNARRGQGEFSGVHGGKKARIASLVTPYRAGLVYHNKANCGAYEIQVLSFPKSKRWDIMDAAAYIIELMEKGLRYFQPKEYSEYQDEKEYEELEKQYRMDELELERHDDCPQLYRMG